MPKFNLERTRAEVKAALENMYMFGGCPRPDPKYNEYLNKMIETIMSTLPKTENDEKITTDIQQCDMPCSLVD